MSNPFDNDCETTYTDKIFRQIHPVATGMSIVLDISPKDVQTARTTIQYLCKKRFDGKKFKTKTAYDGRLWVKRIL